jgi:hypothetical protein
MTTKLETEEQRARNRENCRARYQIKKEEHRVRMAQWRAENPNYNSRYRASRKQEKRALYIVQAVRCEAKKKGVRFDISVGWVQSRLDLGVCELSGLPFSLSSDDRKNLPSVDRRIPGGDYIEDNCRLILFGLNSLIGRNGDAGISRAVARVHELRSEA